MTLFRPCIDLHHGQVKQIVGGTLDRGDAPQTNYVADQPAEYFAELYRQDGLLGGHVIQLGDGNQDAARAALAAYPGGLQVGGGITADNALHWLDAGASKVIVTSWLFPDDRLDVARLETLARVVGSERLVIDLSCRRREDRWWVATQRWQRVIPVEVNATTLQQLSAYCSEFLVHAADVEGLCRGIDEDLVAALGRWSTLPCTYAGGGRSFDDLERVATLSQGRIDLTFGSALDLFGGSGVRYVDCVSYNRSQA